MNLDQLHSVDLGKAGHLETTGNESPFFDVRDPGFRKRKVRVVPVLGQLDAEPLHIAHTEPETHPYSS